MIYSLISKVVYKVSTTSSPHSCLENPRDGGAWRAAFYGVALIRTRLKRLSSSSIPSKRVSISRREPANNHDSIREELQSSPTLCDPIDGSPVGSPVPGILQVRTLEWVAISSSNAWKWKVKVKLLSRVRLFATPWTAAHQAPPSMWFSRQKYWSGVPSPSPIYCHGNFKYHSPGTCGSLAVKITKIKYYCDS